MLTVITTECDIAPLVPVTVTVKVPKVPAKTTLSVEVADPFGGRTTLDGFSITLKPGVTVLVRETVPLKPLMLVMVIVEVEDEPPHPPRTREVGDAAIVKSTKLKVGVAV